MIDAIKPVQRADLLQLALSPRCGREAAGADSSQVATRRSRSSNFGPVAEGHHARGLFVGVAAERMAGPGAETQSDAFCRPESRSFAPLARPKVGPGH